MRMKGTRVQIDVAHREQFVHVGDGRTADQRTAAAMDAELETLASQAQRYGVRDPRWNKLALALLGVRQFTRPLMHDDDRRKS